MHDQHPLNNKNSLVRQYSILGSFVIVAKLFLIRHPSP